MDTPDSMKAELGAWNNGDGIDLQSWIGCEGSFAFAVGYSTVFWPQFSEFEGYVLMKGFSEEALRGFERNSKATRAAVEAVMNHLHIADIQAHGAADISRDKVLFLGSVLQEIYQAKLKWQFPDRRFVVKFFTEDCEDLYDYELSFWQEDNEAIAAG